MIDTPPSVYVIGSLRNPSIPVVSKRLREHGFDVFDDWYAAGPDADDIWRDYEKSRGRDYLTALNEGHHAQHVWDYDRVHLDRCDVGVLVLPAGKSGHLELGYLIGQGKNGYILLDNPDRWDIMYLFAYAFPTLDELVQRLESDLMPVPF